MREKMFFVNIDLKELAECLILKDTFELLRIICEKDNKYKLDSLSESSSSTDSVYDQTPSRKFIQIREYLKKNDIIEPRYFYQRCNDLYFNQGYTKFNWQYNHICPRCLQVGPHVCCASCKNIEESCKCVFRCALAYPSRFTSNSNVEIWAKCSFYCNKYDDKAFQEHLEVCEGVITNDLMITFLEVKQHPTKPYVILTIPKFIDLDKE